jgi:SagB-type dehydrogenase family enzyme
MKRIIVIFCIGIIVNSLCAQTSGTIVLNPPNKTRGLPLMKALSLRASAKDFDTASLKLQDMSDLLWAANGINRPEDGKRTAPSAMNAQDIDVYAVMKSGAYLYDARKQCLDLVANGDHRDLVAGRQEDFAKAPFFCVLVSDISRFKNGADTTKMIWAAEDAGIVSQNISIFCASAGFDTRPRATMDQQKLRDVLKLKASQRLMLNNPVAYKKK